MKHIILITSLLLFFACNEDDKQCDNNTDSPEFSGLSSALTSKFWCTEIEDYDCDDLGNCQDISYTLYYELVSSSSIYMGVEREPIFIRGTWDLSRDDIFTLRTMGDSISAKLTMQSPTTFTLSDPTGQSSGFLVFNECTYQETYDETNLISNNQEVKNNVQTMMRKIREW